MGALYANLSDITALWRQLTQAETERAEALLPVICASLRAEAKKTGRDLDQMIGENPDLAEVAKSVTVDVVARTLMTSTNQEPMTQYSESALGYSVSMNYLNAGQSLYFLRNELKDLGFMRQVYGALEVYGNGSDD